MGEKDTDRFAEDAWTDQPTFVAKWTDHTDDRRYLALVPEFALADLTTDERQAYIRLWNTLEPTPTRAGGLLLTDPFDEIVEPGEHVAIGEVDWRIKATLDPVVEGVIGAMKRLREAAGASDE